MAEVVGQLSIVITATDKMAAGLGSATKSLSAFKGSSTKSLGEALSSLTDSRAFNALSTGASSARVQVSSLARTVTSAALPLSGLGLVGAGVQATTQFVTTAGRIRRGARDLGVSTADLHAFRNAASLSGIDADEASDSLRDFNQAIFDGVGGRNSQIVAFSNSLGISLQGVNGRARQGAELVNDFADAFARLNHDPRALRMAAEGTGLERLLPLLRQGRSAYQERLQQGRALGVMTEAEIAQAERMERQWRRLSVTGNNLTTTIGGALAPALDNAMTQLDGWIRRNERGISDGLSTNVRNVSTALGAFTSMTGQALTATGSWQIGLTALELLLVNRVLKAITGVNFAVSAFRIPTALAALLGISTTTATAGGGVMLGLGAAAGRMNTPMVDDLGRPIGNWGGADGARDSQQPRSGSPPATLGGALGTLGRWMFGGGSAPPRPPGASPNVSAVPDQSLPVGQVQERFRQAATFFQGQGWSREQSIGLATNLRAESNFNENATHDGGIGHGLAGWNRERLTNLGRFVGRDPRTATFEEQLRFAHHELTAGGERAAGDAIRRTRTSGEAADAASRLWERPLAREEAARNRASEAEGWDRRMARTPSAAPTPSAPSAVPAPPVQPPMATPQAVPTPAFTPSQAPPQQPQQLSGAVSVDVRFQNAPRGLIAGVQSEGIATGGTPEINTSMQPWNVP